MSETIVEDRLESADEEAALKNDGSWAARYFGHGVSRLTSTAKRVLRTDAQTISKLILGPDRPDAWPEGRVRTGIVVGGVQSGKTASMLAVSSIVLDAGVDILIVLAGTRVSLWKQTYERLLEQLDGSTPENAAQRWQERVIVPEPLALLRAQRSSPSVYMASAGSRIRDALRRRVPSVLVIPKNDAHLLATSRELQKQLSKYLAKDRRTLRMVVLDDEADDGSVLDAADSKTVPRRIEMLWAGRGAGRTFHSDLLATYVAYTATPQANLLQEFHNPLSPRHFCAALRAPYKTGSLERREPTFAEPAGLPSFYCGGEFFYRELESTPGRLVKRWPFPDAAGLPAEAHSAAVRATCDEMLQDGLRAFLVSATCRYRHWSERGKLKYADTQRPLSEEELKSLPAPHSMLIHPSARLEQHWHEAGRVIAFSKGENPHEARLAPDDASDLRLGWEGIRADLEAHPDRWTAWLSSYEASRSAMELLPGSSVLAPVADDDLEALTRDLREHIVPHVKLRIINSDPAADDRPRFNPVLRGDGTYDAPPDLLTIFVSGNVMSRGITLEGLATTVFTRSSDSPVEDTQMQMQRWFGYRGEVAHITRLICYDDQLELFRQYHQHDTALRQEILSAMEDCTGARALMVLTGSRTLATAKVKTTRLPLHPGAYPFIRLVETGDHAKGNAKAVDYLLRGSTWQPVMIGGREIGRVRSEGLGLEEVAELLNGMRYTHHDPKVDGDPRYERWLSLARQLGIEQALLRPPSRSPTLSALNVRRCPYSIAAYLRLWAECLRRRRCEGLFATHAPEQSWSMISPGLRAPRFNLAIRYGSLSSNSWEGAGLLAGVRALDRAATESDDRTVELSGGWGSRGTDGRYHGDQFIDYHLSDLSPPDREDGETGWRPVGHPGLCLIQVVRPSTGGPDAIAIGLALPHGGPDQFAALRAPQGPQ